LWRNQETNERASEAIMAVLKLSITNPGTTFELPQRRRTFIKNAATPKVKSEIGRAISCNIGLMNVFTIPITIAATTAVQNEASENPGTIYSTTRSAKTLTASLITSFILII